MCSYRYRYMFQIVNWFGHFVQQQQNNVFAELWHLNGGIIKSV